MNVLDLMAVLTLDTSDFQKKLGETEQDTENFGSSFGDKLKGAAKIGITAMGAAVGAASTAVGVMAKSATEAYANYEQLEGGVKKLYGNMGMSVEEYAQSVGKSTNEIRGEWQALEDAQNMVLENAKNAYKTSGMSMNDYMETATSFSASLINSLGGDTVKAAEQTDVAMKAISDNFNTFGGDIGMIQYAYQGFAKQNYTMLDNLKLGYGGTKEEMERLIDDANIYAESIGQASDLSMDSFSDIITAIDLIQQKQHIAGTTSREAATTIEGSFGSAKAAWDNLVAGFADPDADIAQLVSNFVTSASGTVKNLIPAFEQALKGIGQASKIIIPEVVSYIPTVFTDIVPEIISSGINMISAFVDGVTQSAPMISDAFFNILDSIKSWIDENASQVFENGVKILTDFTAGLRDNIGSIVDVGLSIITSLVNGIVEALPTLIEYIPQIIINIAGIINDNLPKILLTGVKLITTLISGIVREIPTLIANFPKIIEAIFAVWSAVNWWSLGKSVITFISNGIRAIAEEIPILLKSIGKKAVEVIKGINWFDLGVNIIQLIGKGIYALVTFIPNMLTKIAGNVIGAVSRIDWLSVGKNIVYGIASGIGKFAGIILDTLLSGVSWAIDGIMNFLDINSPSKRMMRQVGMPMGEGVIVGWDKAMEDANFDEDMKDIVDSMSGSYDYSFEPDTEVLVDTIGSDSNGARGLSKIDKLINVVEPYLQSISNNVGNSIVLDDGTLVGRMAPMMDLELGKISRRRGREL